LSLVRPEKVSETEVVASFHDFVTSFQKRDTPALWEEGRSDQKMLIKPGGLEAWSP